MKNYCPVHDKENQYYSKAYETKSLHHVVLDDSTSFAYPVAFLTNDKYQQKRSFR